MNVALAALGAASLLAAALACGAAGAPPRSGSAPSGSAPSGSAPSASAPSGHLPPLEPLLSGRSSKLLGEGSGRVLRDEASWRAWLMGASHPGDPPPVDFSTSSVIAVDGPDANNGCHAVSIRGWSRDASGAIVVDVARHVPSPGQICTQAMMRPHAAALAPGTLRGEEVRFTWTEVTGPPGP